MKNSEKGQLKFLDLTPSNKEKGKLIKSFKKVISSGSFILGPEVKKFEHKFSKYLGINYCIGVGNGLEALQIAMLSLGIGKEDEVITTPITAAATTLAILAVGATPVFVDADSNGLIKIDLIQKAVSKKTKAILPVHLYGNAVNLEKIKKICKAFKLFLIEDATQAHGSKYRGKKLGTFGGINCFSFYPTKNLGAFGDGGAIVTDNKKLAQICYQIRDYGQKGRYNHIRAGLNSRLDEMQAAFLSLKLKTLDAENNKRRNLAKRYVKNLSSIKEIEIIIPSPEATPNFHQFVIKTKKRNALQKYLSLQGIPTLIHYPKTIPNQPFMKNYSISSFPEAENFVNRCLSLPIDPNLNISNIDFICSQILNFFRKKV